MKLAKRLHPLSLVADIDVIMTVETKGIPLAYATATYMNLPVVIVRRDSRVTEGRQLALTMCRAPTSGSRPCH